MTPKRRQRGPTSQGFTLIEMLVAVTLMALLSVILFEGMRLATRSTAVSSAMIDRSGQLLLAYGVVRAQLSSAEALPAGQSNPPPVDFDGRTEGVSFVELPPAYLAPGGLQRARLIFERSGHIGRLMLSWEPVKTGDPATNQPATMLLDHLSSAEFSYFGSLTADEPPQWWQSWESVDHLPTLVRLRIAFADREQPPDLIVALRLAPLPRSNQ